MRLLPSTVHQQASKPFTGDACITVYILQEENKFFCQSQEAGLWYKWEISRSDSSVHSPSIDIVL